MRGASSRLDVLAGELEVSSQSQPKSTKECMAGFKFMIIIDFNIALPVAKCRQTADRLN